MSNDKKLDLDRLASLACLNLSEEERARLTVDMQAIVAFATGLPAAEEGLCGGEDAVDVSQLREDVSTSFLYGDEMLASAGSVQEGYITVPHVWRENG